MNAVKDQIHDELRWARESMLAKLDDLTEYDIRRPLTPTGTNLLGLIKHLAQGNSRYLGEVFGRPFPEPLPRWDDMSARGKDLWATADETRAEIIDRYHRVSAHGDATIAALPLDAPGHVPWWPSPDVTLAGVMLHVLTETTRHAGHADILREQLDGKVDAPARDWEARYAEIERAALAHRKG